MRNRLLSYSTLCITIALTLASAHAQQRGVRAQIPFSFTVSGKTLGPGRYTMLVRSHQVTIEDGSGQIVALVLANQVSGHSARIGGEITFHCYAYRCFLSEVWTPFQENGLRFTPPRVELELAKQQSGTYFAVLAQKQ
jgi:hypothetical protein